MSSIVWRRPPPLGRPIINMDLSSGILLPVRMSRMYWLLCFFRLYWFRLYSPSTFSVCTFCLYLPSAFSVCTFRLNVSCSMRFSTGSGIPEHAFIVRWYIEWLQVLGPAPPRKIWVVFMLDLSTFRAGTSDVALSHWREHD